MTTKKRKLSSAKAPKPPAPPKARVVREGVSSASFGTKKFARTTLSDFKKMTLAAVMGKLTPLSTTKNWVAGLSNKGVVGVLRDTFITNPKTPHAAQMHEWAKIDRLQRENHPVACFLLKDVPSYFRVKQMRLNDVIWWVKYRTMSKHNHHTVNTGLKPGYHGSDEILLHATMSVLVDYVENTNHGGSECGEYGLSSYIDFYEKLLDPKNWSDWERKSGKKHKKQRIEHDTKTVNSLKEMLLIYRWWKYYRKVEHLALEQERNTFYDSIEFHFMDAERDFTKLKGKEKERYLKEREISNIISNKEEKLYEVDTDMITRFAKIRRTLW